MDIITSSNKGTLGIVSAIFVVGIIAGYFIIKQEDKLPYYSPKDVNQELVDPSTPYDSKQLHTIPNFELIDQNGNRVTPKNVEGKIYVADFFFATCDNICIDMAKQFHRIQTRFKDNDEVVLLSHSVTPVKDSVAALRQYATLKGAIDDKWMITTGDKKHIYDLARKAYFAATSQGDGGPDDFIHTENFVLVDKEKHIRGYYDGTDPKSVDQLMLDIAKLLKEYD